MTIRSMTIREDPDVKGNIIISADGTTYPSVSREIIKGSPGLDLQVLIERGMNIPIEVIEAAKEMLGWEPADDTYTTLEEADGQVRVESDEQD